MSAADVKGKDRGRPFVASAARRLCFPSVWVVALAIAAPAARAVGPLDTAKLTAADLGGDCALDEHGYDGSLHAALLADDSALWTPRLSAHGGKARQTVVCHGVPSALYWFHYESADAAADALPPMGAFLWGTGAPSDEHPDELLAKGELVAVVAGQNPAWVVRVLEQKRGMQPYRSSAAKSSQDSVPDVRVGDLEVMQEMIHCKSGGATPAKSWCHALDAFAHGHPLGATPLALAGASLLVVGDQVSEEASYFVVNGSGASVGSVTPENEAERRQTTALIELVNHGGRPTDGDPIVGYAHSLSSKANHPLASIGESSVFASVTAVTRVHAFARDTGKSIVVVEWTGNAAKFGVGVFPK